jgi:peptidyl-prolyl cis-trans isomerase D
MALAFLRRHQRWFHVLLGIVILGFIFVYIPMFQDASAGGASEEVGRVAETPITAMEYQTALMRLRGRYEQMYGRQLDPNMLRMLGLESQVFDSLVDQRVIEIEARRHGIVVSDRDLAEYVASMPSLQDNGRFIGGAKLKEVLERQGQTLSEFERALRNDLMRQRLEALITDGVTVTPAEVEQEYRRRNEEIKTEYVLVESASFTPQASVSDDEVRARFESATETYRIPETRVASYVFVDPQAMRAQAAVTDADIAAHYKAQKDEYTEKEQVCARHVLIKVKDAEAKEGRTDDEAKQVAMQLLTQLAGGADFAAIATKNSEDEGSAAKGGDLGCFARGTMVNEFENVAFNLENGAMSDLVKTQYGYHIIKTMSRTQEKLKPLDEVKESIRFQLSGTRSQTLTQQKADAIAAALARGGKLEDAARENGLQVQTSPPLRRGEAAPPLSPEVVKRVFDLKPGETARDAIALNGGFAFVTLTEIKEPRAPELAEVQEKVKADATQAKAMELARARAQDLKAKAGTAGLEKAAATLGLTRKTTTAAVKRGEPMGEIPSGAALDEAAFALAPGAISDPIPVATGFAVVRVTEKKAVDTQAFEKEKAALSSTLREDKRRRLFDAYVAQARLRVPVERRPEVLRRVRLTPAIPLPGRGRFRSDRPRSA